MNLYVFPCYRHGWLAGHWDSWCYSRRRRCSWWTVIFAYSICYYIFSWNVKENRSSLSRANWRPILKNLSLEIESIKWFCVQGFQFLFYDLGVPFWIWVRCIIRLRHIVRHVSCISGEQRYIKNQRRIDLLLSFLIKVL